MRALLVTGCGCTKTMEVSDFHRDIRIPMRVSPFLDPSGDRTSAFQQRDFEYERDIEDLDGLVAVYREVLR